MAMRSDRHLGLREAVDLLDVDGGPIPAPFPTDPFEQVLWVNVAYLADDDARRAAFERLRESVGTSPRAVLAAGDEDLLAVTGAGILPEQFVTKLRRAAEIALEEFGGDPAEVLSRPVKGARRALRRFPGIAEPGADKILLFARAHPSLAPESNCLRVMVRLGLLPAGLSYGATYSAARSLGDEVFAGDFAALLRARHLLREHGRRVCRNKRPACDVCVLADRCPSAGVDA